MGGEKFYADSVLTHVYTVQKMDTRILQVTLYILKKEYFFSQFDEHGVWVTHQPIEKLYEIERLSEEFARSQPRESWRYYNPKRGDVCVVRWREHYCRALVKNVLASQHWKLIMEWVTSLRISCYFI